VFFLEGMSSSEEVGTALLRDAGIAVNGRNPWDIKVKNPKLFDRLFAGGSLALGESYMEGWWDCKSLDQFFDKLLQAKIEKKVVSTKAVMAIVRAKIWNMQTKTLSKTVAKQHYNLGNELYKKMLGTSMQYSCAYFNGTKDLNKAQEKKLELICKKLKLKKGETVLDIGSGWGSLSCYMAKKYKCKVTALNISDEQIKFAKTLCKNLSVRFIKQDYRDHHGQYDKIVSIGMFEHVGPKNYAEYMQVAHRCLKDHGLFLLHTIGGNQSVHMIDPWLEKYIFPGAVLPSTSQIATGYEGLFVMEDWHNFGQDYDKTLMAWFKNFDKAWPTLKKDYDDRFYRMWKYYLLSCAGSFRSRKNQLWQIMLSKNGVPGGYAPVR